MGCRAAGAASLTLSFAAAAPGLRLPTSNNDPRFDREDGELEADREPGCCPCQHPPPGQVLPPLEAQEASFQKKFENFLHNAITIPKCVSARESREARVLMSGVCGPGSGGAGPGLWVGLGGGPPLQRALGRLPGGPDRAHLPDPPVSPDPLGR